jgi:prepilin peptidase CpaA
LFKTFDVVAVFAIAGWGLATAAIDLRERRIPNQMTFGIATLGFLLAAFHLTGVGVVSALAGLAVGLALMLPSHVIGATGAGDVKLLAAFGTLLGPGRTGWAFLYTAIAGGVIALIVATRRKRIRLTLERTTALLQKAPGTAAAIEHPQENNRFAYAPAIVAGALAAAMGL